jgi:hypothetical protein
MTIQAEQARRLETIRKLLAKAEDQATTAAEAESLSAKAAELMQKYCIDQAMLDAAARVTRKPQTVGKRTIVFDNQDFVPVRQRLLHAVADHNNCTTVIIDRAQPPRSELFGFESDLDVTEMLYTSLIVQAANALIAEDVPFGETPRSFTSAWWAGFASRIGTRLYYSRLNAQKQAEAAEPGTAVVLKNRRDEVENAFRTEHPTTRTSRAGRGGRSRAGRAAGAAAGSRATLTTPGNISGGSASRALGR